MPIQPQRTWSLSRVKKKTPGKRLVTHYIKRKPSKAECAVCKKELLGVPNLLTYKLRGLPKTQRRPERPYGGYLCHSCLKKKLLERTSNLKNEKIEPGRLCVKTTGREAGRIAVILEVLNDKFVLIDGQVKRRRCNINHLETLDKKIKVTKNITKDELKKEFEALGYKLEESKAKVKQEKPKKVKKQKETKEEVKEKKKKESKPKKEKK